MNSQEPSPEIIIQPADPAARRRTLWIILVLIILAGLLAFFGNIYGDAWDEWLNTNGPDIIQKPGIVFAVMFVLMLPLMGAAVYVQRMGNRIIEAQRIPLPEQKVVKDTPVISGKKAVRQGKAMRIMAIFMWLFALLTPFFVVLIIMTIQKSS